MHAAFKSLQIGKKEAVSTNYYDQPRHEMLAYVDLNSKRILEVGCGSGAFAQSIRLLTKAEYWAVEPNPDAAECAAQVVDFLKVEAVEDAIAKLPAEYFDTVIFNDVLEHLVDPFEVLRQIKRILSPGGRVVASIPNIRYEQALYHIVIQRDFRYTDHGIFDRTHLRFFTKQSILRTFEQSGYEIVSIDGLAPPPGERGRRWHVIRALSFLGFLDEMLYKQFACVAQKANAV